MGSKKQKQLFICYRRYVTLLESLIAMFLLSMLLVLVFGFFREFSILKDQSKKTLKEAFQQRYMEARLAYIFSHLVNENKTGKIFYFFTCKDEVSNSPSLAFTFMNGSSLDPYVGGDVLARLFVDEQTHRLCLAILPIPQSAKQTEEELQSHIKREYLLDHVQSISFQCLSAFCPKQKKDKNPPPLGMWMSEWSKEYKRMPVIIKIEVAFMKESDSQAIPKPNKVFAFVLPSSKHPVTFVSK